MKSKYLNLLKGIFEIALLVLVVVCINRVMVLKSEDGYDQMKSFYKQKDGTVDALFLGSSRMYCQVDTGILWDEYGISGYDLGGAEATTWNSYYFLREALKNQRPKVIFYDVGILAYRPDVEFQESKWAMTNNYGMKWNSNRIAQLKANTEDNKSYRSMIFPLDTMHSRYLELTENDFDDVNNDIAYKGFDYRDATTPLERPDVSHVAGQTPLSDKQQEYMVKMFELAKSENIPFNVVVAPYAVSEEDQRIFNYIHAMCDENEIQFIDFNTMYDELGIDFSTDYAESLHMNFAGTKKFSSYLGKYITENYEVIDHRGDAMYVSWDRDALINRQNRLEYELNHTAWNDELDESIIGQEAMDGIAYMTGQEHIDDILRNGNYIVFVIDNMANLSVYDNSERVIRADGGGEYKSTIADGNLRVIVSRIDDTTTLNINRKEIVVGFPWRRVIAYDKVLEKIVYDYCWWEEN